MKVTPSAGASQPHFGPQRLANGITKRFDYFLGFPRVPEPLEVVIELKEEVPISRIQITERAINRSWEKYDVLVSKDGESYEKVGGSNKGLRGTQNIIGYRFDSRPAKFIKLVTHGVRI